MSNGMLVVAALSVPPGVWVLFRIASSAYFNSKLEYQMKLMNGLTKEAPTNGE